MAVIIALLVAVAVGLGGTVGLDAIIGDKIMPDDALSGLERAGEAVLSSVGLANHKALALERIKEAESLAAKGENNRANELLDQASSEARNLQGEDMAFVRDKIAIASSNIQRGAYR